MVRLTGGTLKGKPKSGRIWKVETRGKSSVQTLSSLNRDCYEVRRRKKQKLDDVKALERSLKTERLEEVARQKELRDQRQQKRMENELKSSSYQVLNHSKLKTMSKKQLRMVKKTSMNKNGQIELVNIHQKR